MICVNCLLIRHRIISCSWHLNIYTQNAHNRSLYKRQIFKASTTLGTVTWEQLSRIERMHTQIAEGVNMDFNYCCLLGIASIVAGLGLALDSSTTVISSMLLSPIMGKWL